MSAPYDLIHTRPSVDRLIDRIASRQHGLFTRKQAAASGATKAIISWRVRAGRWQRVYPDVFRLAGNPRTWRQDALAACLHYGGTVAFGTAAVLRGFLSRRGGRVEVLAPRNRNRRAPPGVVVRSNLEPLLDPEHRVAIEADSFRYYDTRRSFDAERARGNELLALGWQVLRVTAKHLAEDPDSVAAWVRKALSRYP
ncbi:MAG: type IV toxin-antitoxin system AbiEi family antitoxin domain-containing protein [Actinomycetota bacterium]